MDNMTTPAKTGDDMVADNLRQQAAGLIYDPLKDLNANVAKLFPVIQNTAFTTANNVLTLQEIRGTVEDLRSSQGAVTSTGSGYNTRAQDAQIESNIVAACVSALRVPAVQQILKYAALAATIALINYFMHGADPATATRIQKIENILMQQAGATNLTSVKP